MDWEGKNFMNGGQRGQYGSYAEFAAKAQAQAETILKNAQAFEQMKPLLVKCLHHKIQNRLPIKVIQPIQNISTSINKGEKASAGIGGSMIPSGIELVYNGFELGQFFFKSFRNGVEGPEYGVFSGENVVIGNQQVVRNPGLIGLLTRTNVFTDLLQLLNQGESESQ